MKQRARGGRPAATDIAATAARTPSTRRRPRAATGGAAQVADGDAQASLAERAYVQIEEMLVSMRIPPGALMSEPDLARRLGMSRTPVSDAMRRLARAGLVTILPRRGFVATELSVASQLRLLELRREVARLVARAAAVRAGHDRGAELAAIAQAFVQAAERGDRVAYMKSDHAFHALIARCADNAYAAQALESLDAQARRFFFAHRISAQELLDMARLHEEIALAVQRGDSAAAGQACDALSDRLDRLTRATIDAIGRLGAGASATLAA